MNARQLSYVLALAGSWSVLPGCGYYDVPDPAIGTPSTSHNLHHPPGELSLALRLIDPRYLTFDNKPSPQALTIHGSGFEQDMTLKIGADVVARFSVISATVLELVWTPTSSALGPIPVSLTASSGNTVQRNDLLYSRLPAAPDLSFGNVCEKIGYSPTAIAVADLNGDGVDDIITANDLVPEIVYALSDGHGNVKSGMKHLPSAAAYDLQVADMNHDGILDLVVVTYTPTGGFAVGIRAGDGKLGFGPLRNFATTYLPSSVAIGDFNGDGWPDVALANQSDGSIELYLNGKASPAALDFPKKIGFSAQPRALYFADIDNDANLDLVFLDEMENKGVVLFGNGIDAASRQVQIAEVTAGTPQLLLVADVNNDSYKDLIVSSAENNTVAIWRNEKDDHFSLNSTLQAGGQPTALAAADFDGDAKMDIAVSNGSGSDVGIFTQTRSNNYNQVMKSFTSDLSPVGMKSARLHAAAKPDLVVANRGLCTVSLLMNDVPSPTDFKAR